MRVFHWLLVLSFAYAFVTAESKRWRLVHVTLGYTVAGLIAFRLIWGLVGTRYAWFHQLCARSPPRCWLYLRALLRGGNPEHYVGLARRSGWAIVALLGALLTASGWATYNEWGGDWLEELHMRPGNGFAGAGGCACGGRDRLQPPAP